MLAVLACTVYVSDRRASSASAKGPVIAGRHEHILGKARGQWEIVNAVLAEFHKAQCYLATALQIASAVVVFSNFNSTNYND